MNINNNSIKFAAFNVFCFLVFNLVNIINLENQCPNVCPANHKGIFIGSEIEKNGKITKKICYYSCGCVLTQISGNNIPGEDKPKK